MKLLELNGQTCIKERVAASKRLSFFLTTILAARHYSRQQRRFPSRDSVRRGLLDATRLSWHMPRVPSLVSPIAC
jgi:hypothetical protein